MTTTRHRIPLADYNHVLRNIRARAREEAPMAPTPTALPTRRFAQPHCADCYVDDGYVIHYCPTHAAAPALRDFVSWIVNGDPRQSNADRLTGIKRQARALLATLDGTGE